MKRAGWSDRRIVLWMGALMIVLIIAITTLAPGSAEDDPRPTTYNNGPQGARAAFLLLQAIGRPASHWDGSLDELNRLDAAHTTLVLPAPNISATEQQAAAASVKQFLQRGGHVLTTGSIGALLLPGGKVDAPTVFLNSGCRTRPADGPLAGSGSVSMVDGGRWAGTAPFETAHRCGEDAVVVRMSVGPGEAVWWSSPTPLTNAQLKNDSSLRLLLLSLGESRAVVWSDSLQEKLPGLWTPAHGLPLRWLALQIVAIALLLILSFSRRKGPIRSPVLVPRSSPIEFAFSMGDLYAKARATAAPIDAARRRLVRVITREAGIPPAVVEQGPQAVVTMLEQRLGGDWKRVGQHLEKARELRESTPTVRETVVLSRTLIEDAESLRRAATGGRTSEPAAARTAEGLTVAQMKNGEHLK